MPCGQYSNVPTTLMTATGLSAYVCYISVATALRHMTLYSVRMDARPLMPCYSMITSVGATGRSLEGMTAPCGNWLTITAIRVGCLLQMVRMPGRAMKLRLRARAGARTGFFGDCISAPSDLTVGLLGNIGSAQGRCLGVHWSAQLPAQSFRPKPFPDGDSSPTGAQGHLLCPQDHSPVRRRTRGHSGR